MIAIQDSKTSPHDGFLEIMPTVERHARWFFRGMSPADREEAVAEAVAAALVSFIRLTQRGKNPFDFPSKIAMRAVQHVRNDRHVGTRSNGRDVLSRKARVLHGYGVVSILPESMQDAVEDNTQSSVPQQVIFRCDVPA